MNKNENKPDMAGHSYSTSSYLHDYKNRKPEILHSYAIKDV